VDIYSQTLNCSFVASICPMLFSLPRQYSRITDSRYWSYSLHAQINSAVCYALFLPHRLHGVKTLAGQTHQLLEVLHPGLLPQLQLHVVTQLRLANVCMYNFSFPVRPAAQQMH